MRKIRSPRSIVDDSSRSATAGRPSSSLTRGSKSGVALDRLVAAVGTLHARIAHHEREEPARLRPPPGPRRVEFDSTLATPRRDRPGRVLVPPMPLECEDLDPPRKTCLNQYEHGNGRRAPRLSGRRGLAGPESACANGAKARQPAACSGT